jgi:hypothetical protein
MWVNILKKGSWGKMGVQNSTIRNSKLSNPYRAKALCRCSLDFPYKKCSAIRLDRSTADPMNIAPVILHLMQ